MASSGDPNATLGFTRVQSALTKITGAHPKHTADIIHASYAAALRIPFVGDNKFVNVINNAKKSKKWKAELGDLDALYIKEMAQALGVN